MKINKLNSVIKNELIAEPCSFEDLIFIESLLNIVKNNIYNIRMPEYEIQVDINKSIEYSLEFIESVNPKYKEELLYALENDKVIFEKDMCDDPISKLVVNKGKKYINLSVTDTILDSYSFTHEGFHYLNTDAEKLTSNWHLMTETFSMTAESLQKIFFSKKYYDLKEYKYNEINNYFGINERALILDFEICLLKEYMKNGKVTEDFIHELLKDKDDNYIELACFDMGDMIDIGYMNFSMFQRYIISAVLSAHLLKRVISKNNYKEFIELNDKCNDMSFVETLKYLNLKLIDEKYVILSDDSLKLLNNEYFEKVLSLKR